MHWIRAPTAMMARTRRQPFEAAMHFRCDKEKGGSLGKVSRPILFTPVKGG